MSMWKRAMDYLGLGPEDAYDDYDMGHEPERQVRGPRPVRDEGPRPVRREPDTDHGVRAVRSVPQVRDADVTIRRPVPAGDDSTVQPRPINPRPVAPRPAGAPGDAVTVRPVRYNDVQQVADRFKHGQQVLMYLDGSPSDIKRRILDFVAGLCYALGGSIVKVGDSMWMLTPRGHDDAAADD
ncbi:MAG: cell division protein SepF [Ilumatobacteraceae bacterium]|jgi:cell division inhibitor SepF